MIRVEALDVISDRPRIRDHDRRIVQHSSKVGIAPRTLARTEQIGAMAMLKIIYVPDPWRRKCGPE